MTLPVLAFWACAACVVYAYVGYPALIGLRARWRGRPPRLGPCPGSVSIVVSALDEEATIGRRLEELTGLLAASGRRGEVVLVSDGSTDRTAAIARGFTARGVRVLDRPDNAGKAVALTEGCATVDNDFIVFADARQSWAPDALERLLENFADPDVGAVSGDLIIESSPGVMAGVGLYWRYEKWLRRREGLARSMVGVTGAICAVRRELFRPIPPGTILDDVYWPLRVAMQGFRVVHDDRAHAFDRLPEQARDEFRRKVRTLSGNFQLLRLLPGAVLPWRNPIWFEFVSHKLARLVVPWALIALLPLSLLIDGPIHRLAFAAQAAFYLAALLGLSGRVGPRLKLAAAASSFLVLNAAAWCAFWVWAFGRTTRSWKKATYAIEPSQPVGAP